MYYLKSLVSFHAQSTDVKIAVIIPCLTIELVDNHSLRHTALHEVLRFTRVFYGKLAPCEVSETIHTPIIL
jgi:hypothetical protein